MAASIKNQTTEHVLANKGIELNIVFSLKVDELLFFFVNIKPFVGWNNRSVSK